MLNPLCGLLRPLYVLCRRYLVYFWTCVDFYILYVGFYNLSAFRTGTVWAVALSVQAVDSEDREQRQGTKALHFIVAIVHLQTFRAHVPR